MTLESQFPGKDQSLSSVAPPQPTSATSGAQKLNLARTTRGGCSMPTWIQGAWGKVSEGSMTAWNWFAGKCQALWGKVSEGSKTAWNWFAGKCQALWNSISLRLKEIWALVCHLYQLFRVLYFAAAFDAMKRRWIGWVFTAVGIIFFLVELCTEGPYKWKYRYYHFSWSLLLVVVPMFHVMHAAYHHVKKKFALSRVEGLEALGHVMGGLEFVIGSCHVIALCMDLKHKDKKILDLTVILGCCSGALGVAMLEVQGWIFKCEVSAKKDTAAGNALRAAFAASKGSPGAQQQIAGAANGQAHDGAMNEQNAGAVVIPENGEQDVGGANIQQNAGLVEAHENGEPGEEGA